MLSLFTLERIAYRFRFDRMETLTAAEPLRGQIVAALDGASRGRWQELSVGLVTH